MAFITRLCFVAALAVFAASAVAHAVGPSFMAPKMATSDMAVMPMGGCDACDDTDAGAGGIVCDIICSAGGFTAIPLAEAGIIPVATPDCRGLEMSRDLPGFASPPAKKPPRFFI